MIVYIVLMAYLLLIASFVLKNHVRVITLRGLGKPRQIRDNIACCLLAAIPSMSEGWRMVLPISGSFIETIAQIRKRPREIRLSKILYCSPVWIVYNLMAHSISGAITEVINMISVGISIARFGLDTMDMAEVAPKGAQE